MRHAHKTKLLSTLFPAVLSLLEPSAIRSYADQIVWLVRFSVLRELSLPFSDRLRSELIYFRVFSVLPLTRTRKRFLEVSHCYFLTCFFKESKIKPLEKNENLMLNIGSLSCGGRIINVKGRSARLMLQQPVCTSEGEKIAISRRIDRAWRLIGWGDIKKGVKSELGGVKDEDN